MPFVKRAPGRHKANALSFSSQVAPCRHHSRNAIYYLHRTSEAIDASRALQRSPELAALSSRAIPATTWLVTLDYIELGLVCKFAERSRDLE